MLERNVPPGWLLGVSPPHYILGRARADARTHGHTLTHTPIYPGTLHPRAGAPGRRLTHSLTHPPTNPPTLSQTAPNLPTAGFGTAEFPL